MRQRGDVSDCKSDRSGFNSHRNLERVYMTKRETKERRIGRRRKAGMEEGDRKGTQSSRREYRRGQLEAVRKRVVKRRGKGETVRRVGTGRRAGGRRKGMDVESKKGKGKVVKVTEAWVSGRLTNNEGLSTYVKRKKEAEKRGGGEEVGREDRWYEKNRKGRDGRLEANKKRPGLMVVRNPGEQGVARKEAVRCGIPTVGRVTEKREKDREKRRTYGRPMDKGKEGILRRVNRRKRVYEEETTKV